MTRNEQEGRDMIGKLTTQWKVIVEHQTGQISVSWGGIKEICRCKFRADADQIVREHNSHEAVIEALKGLYNICTHPKATKAQIAQIANEARTALVLASH